MLSKRTDAIVVHLMTSSANGLIKFMPGYSYQYILNAYSRNRIGSLAMLTCFIFRGNLELTSALMLLYRLGLLILQHNGTVMWDVGRLHIDAQSYCHCVPNVLLVTYCVADCTRRIFQVNNSIRTHRCCDGEQQRPGFTASDEVTSQCRDPLLGTILHKMLIGLSQD